MEYEYKRNCPQCGKEIKYKTLKACRTAEKNETLCKDCRFPQQERYVRPCPQCGKEKIYKNKYSFNQSSPNKLCRSCISATTMKGKTIYGQWLEKYGKEEADNRHTQWYDNICKRKNCGKNNPNYQNKSNGARVLAEIGRAAKGKTIEEIHGQEKAIMIKKKLSKASSGKNNPMYGKPAPQGSGNGWSGYYAGYYFRSLLELAYLKQLLDNNIQFESGEKKDYTVEYTLDGKDRIYHPDYYLVNTKQVIEVKPKSLVSSRENKTKFQAAKQKYGDNFIIITEEQIIKLSFSEIESLYFRGLLKFDKRYEQKFQEYVNERG